jgi:hypothetical protein
LPISVDFTFEQLKHLISSSRISFRAAVFIGGFWLLCFLGAKTSTGYFTREVEEALKNQIPAGVDLRDGDFWASETLTARDTEKWVLNHRQPDENAFRLDNFVPYRRHVAFDPPFIEVPRVLTVLSDLEISPGENIRLMTSVGNVRKDGCDIIIYTWNVSTIDVVAVHWLAYLPAPSEKKRPASSH